MTVRVSRENTMKTYSKEMYDLMAYFERIIGKVSYCSDFTREDKALWANGHYYCNGRVNEMFLVYMAGYSHGKSVQRDCEYI